MAPIGIEPIFSYPKVGTSKHSRICPIAEMPTTLNIMGLLN